MTTASVSEIKARLSEYIRIVRRGGEVQILDRGVPVARLIGVTRSSDSDDERRQRLIAAGVVRPGRGDVGAVLRTEPLEIDTNLRAALDDDRADRL